MDAASPGRLTSLCARLAQNSPAGSATAPTWRGTWFSSRLRPWR